MVWIVEYEVCRSGEPFPFGFENAAEIDETERESLSFADMNEQTGKRVFWVHYLSITGFIPRLIAPMRTTVFIPTTEKTIDIHDRSLALGKLAEFGTWM